METLLITLTLIFILIFAVPLAILAAGIRRQEHAGSLTCEPGGISAALTSRVVGLRTARTPAPAPAQPVRPTTTHR